MAALSSASCCSTILLVGGGGVIPRTPNAPLCIGKLMAVPVFSSQDRGTMLAPSSALLPEQGWQTTGATGSLQNLKKFNSQDFKDLRALCLSQGLLFEDATFPAHVSSIGPTLLPEEKLWQIQWKRPTVSSSSSGISWHCCWMGALMASGYFTLGLQVCVVQQRIPPGEHWKHTCKKGSLLWDVWREDNLCNINDFTRYIFVGSLLLPVKLTRTTVLTLICFWRTLCKPEKLLNSTEDLWFL